MNGSERPRISPDKLPRSAFRGDRRYYEGGNSIPVVADKSEIQERFRRKFAEVHARPIEAAMPPERFTDLDLGYQPAEGQPQLPVYDFKQTILDSVAQNQVTIVTAETGAGKSTQLPQYLLEAGYLVNMTQPRRLSAAFVSEEIERQLGLVLGEETAEELVGFHTAEQNTTTENTRITVLTDGLRLAQEFGQRDELEDEVLVIDEVHEWNTNIEVLIAQAKRLVHDKAGLRVVIMSATMEADRLARHFAKGGHSRPPVIEVPGRNHEVTRSEEPNSTVVQQALKYAQEGHNILIFLPGVREIQSTIRDLESGLSERGVEDAVLLPLHSKMSRTAQDAVKESYAGPKIICATNIAQTSITIPDVTVVIDSGLERRTEIDREGVQSLNLRPVSRADMDQRAGRTGRVGPGQYIGTALNDSFTFESYESKARTDYPVAEILRTDVDRSTLLAASAGIDFADLDLFHPISMTVINRSKRALEMLGAFDEDGQITASGMRMSRLPMRPMYARMVTEAEDLGLKSGVRAYVAGLVSAMEVGGMPDWQRGSGSVWKSHTKETSSDLIAQLDLFIAARDMSEADLYANDFDVRNVERARELYRKVCKRTNIAPDQALAPPNAVEREELRRVIAAGMIDNIYRRSGRDEYVRLLGKTGVQRAFSDRSTVRGVPQYVMGTPYRIERFRRGDVTEDHVIQDVTALPSQLLAEIGPSQLRTWEDDSLQWRGGRLKRVQKQLFRQAVETGLIREEEAAPTVEALAEVERYILENSGSALRELKQVKRELEQLQRLTKRALPSLSTDQIRNLLRDAIAGEQLNPEYIDHLLRVEMHRQQLSLEQLVPEAERQQIIAQSPEWILHNGAIIPLYYRAGDALYQAPSLDIFDEWGGELHLPDGRPVQVSFGGRVYSYRDYQATQQG